MSYYNSTWECIQLRRCRRCLLLSNLALCIALISWLIMGVTVISVMNTNKTLEQQLRDVSQQLQDKDQELTDANYRHLQMLRKHVPAWNRFEQQIHEQLHRTR